MIFLSFSIVFLTSLMLLIVTAYWVPGYTKHFIREDYLLENMTAGIFIVAGILAATAAVISKKNRIKNILLSFLGVIFFLEELSWGNKIIGYKSPIIWNIRVDSLHDIIELIGSIPKHWNAQPLLIPGIAILLIAAIAAYEKRRSVLNFVFSKTGIFLAIAALMLFFSVLIDSHLINLSKYIAVNPVIFEEYFEMSAGLALFFLCLSLLADELRFYLNLLTDRLKSVGHKIYFKKRFIIPIAAFLIIVISGVYFFGKGDESQLKEDLIFEQEKNIESSLPEVIDDADLELEKNPQDGIIKDARAEND